MVITATKKTVFFHFILIFVSYLSYPSQVISYYLSQKH